ncbi:MAG: hypothetical protein JWQ81_8376 [Amycolatopsis sp.]|jgi:uncharacterized protein YdhG (YjbR/CyaY superfamily)|uniref:iron chaperone n=1 Tax=Amycolatopsis sp. TaxID=37632 RepID=UPI002602D6D0|nr:DUF1801 domain-containing protein [Amycolatopsis sp.]MCU1687637.1 hypothetical protein [Amycolatopsis sp.]
MAATDIDAYLAHLTEPERRALNQLRSDIHAVLPEAQECISYGMPAFRVHGEVVAGFAAFKNHLSYLPHSGSVLSALAEDLADYEMTKGSLHFPPDQPLPRALLQKLVATRLRQAGIHQAQPAHEDAVRRARDTDGR